VIGVDNRRRLPPPAHPTVAVLGNGAGLTMATYDQIALAGVSVAGAIELHGALARRVEHTAKVFEAFFMLDADAYFVNAFYQLRWTEPLAQALVQALDANPELERERVVVRVRGVNQDSSRRIIEAARCFYSPSLKEAADRALAVARSRVARK